MKTPSHLLPSPSQEQLTHQKTITSTWTESGNTKAAGKSKLRSQGGTFYPGPSPTPHLRAIPGDSQEQFPGVKLMKMSKAWSTCWLFLSWLSEGAAREGSRMRLLCCAALCVWVAYGVYMRTLFSAHTENTHNLYWLTWICCRRLASLRAVRSKIKHIHLTRWLIVLVNTLIHAPYSFTTFMLLIIRVV